MGCMSCEESGFAGSWPRSLLQFGELPRRVIIELAGEARHGALALGVRPVTGGAGRNVGRRHAFLKDFLAGGDELARLAAERLGVQVLKTLGQRRQHAGPQNMRHVEHHGVHAPALDEGLELVLQIFRLLPGETRHRIGAAEALARNAVAGLAIGEFGLELGARRRVRLRRFRLGRRGLRGLRASAPRPAPSSRKASRAGRRWLIAASEALSSGSPFISESSDKRRALRPPRARGLSRPAAWGRPRRESLPTIARAGS